ncbi:zinc finger, C2H2 type, partial [Cooperia oncophora]
MSPMEEEPIYQGSTSRMEQDPAPLDKTSITDSPSVAHNPAPVAHNPGPVAHNPGPKVTSTPEKSERNPRALDKLDSSFESDAQTVVEKDENGFVYYRCRFCGLTFNYMNTLRAHERVHNISQPFVCGKCGDSFEFACQLEYHTQQHGGEFNTFDVKCYTHFYPSPKKHFCWL